MKTKPRKPIKQLSNNLDIEILKNINLEWTAQDRIAVESSSNTTNQSWWLTDSVFRIFKEYKKIIYTIIKAHGRIF